jgi:large subunit ribosomal protein L25
VKKVTVTAEPRGVFGSPLSRKLRHEGWVPAVVYGRALQPKPLQIRAADARALVRQGQRLVDLAAGGETRKVFIRDIQYDATGDAILHIDFNQIAMDELLTLEVPVELTGKPVGIAAEGGVLDVYVKHVAVRCLPDAIPEKLVADIAHLKLNDNFTVGDLKAPAGVTIVAAADVVVAGVHPPHVLEIAPAAAEAGPAEPELIKKPAAEEAPAEGAEAKPAKAAKGEEEKAEKKK